MMDRHAGSHAQRRHLAEAQRLMDELRNIMQNLQTAQRNEMFSDPHTRELNRQFDELERTDPRAATLARRHVR